MACIRAFVFGVHVVTCSVALACGSSSDSVECGEGTVEREGACVPEQVEDDANGAAGDSGSVSAGDTDANDDSSSGADGDLEFYGACPGLSDVECVSSASANYFESCRAAVNGCTANCVVDAGCRPPASGTAVQRCVDLSGIAGWQSGCILGCHADLTCPTGMECATVAVLADNGFPSEAEVCVWP